MSIRHRIDKAATADLCAVVAQQDHEEFQQMQELRRVWRRHERSNWLFRHGIWLFIEQQKFFSGSFSEIWIGSHIDTPELFSFIRGA